MTEATQEIIIPNISPTRNYWLVRTESGLYYSSFDVNNYIAIGWNEIDQNIVNKKSEISKEDILTLCPQSKDKTPSQQSRQATLIANNINKFINEIKEGDIVMIPSVDSEYVTFGEVSESKLYFEKDFPTITPTEPSDPKFCPYVKRKKVKWLKTIKRQKLDPELYKVFHSHHTINDANSYAQFIDRAIDSIFIKGDTAHLTLYVEKKGNINALMFSDLIRDTLTPIDKFKEITNREITNIKATTLNKNNISIKTNVQSPGPIELIGSVSEIIFIVSMIVSLDSNKYKFKIKNLFNKKEDEKENDNKIRDIIKAFNDEDIQSYTNELEKEKKDIEQHLKNLKIKNPKDNINSTKEKAN